MEAEEQEQVAVARARRGLWIFRLAFYPAAVGLAVLAIGARGDDGPPPTETHTGSTTQDRRLFLGLRDGQPAFLDTVLLGTCAGDRWRLWHWQEEAGALKRTGDRLSYRYAGPFMEGSEKTQLELSLDGRFEDGQARGRIAYRQVFTATGFECAADVRFSVPLD